MNRFKTKDLNGGMPIVLNDLRFLLGQDGYATAGIYKVFEGYLNSFGTDFIISGCVAAGAPGAITEGWIFLDGEIIKVDAHTGTDTYYEKITDTYHSDGDKTFQDGTTNDTYQQIRAKCTAAAGDLAYNGDTWDKKINDKFGTRLLRKVVTFSAWNMDTANQKQVNHSIANGKTKIKSADVFIVGSDTVPITLNYINFDLANAGNNGWYFDDTQFVLRRATDGFFDTGIYNNASGWITIWYIG